MSKPVVTHEFNTWWEKNLSNTQEWQKFANWLGHHKDPSRVMFLEYIKLYNCESLLEVAPGMFRCYDNLKTMGWPGDYKAVDITPKIVELGVSKGIDVAVGNVDDLHFEDGSIDVVYCRHLMEHLDYYEDAIREMVRVAKKAIIVIFYKPPHHTNEEDVLELTEEMGVYHNYYSRPKLDRFLKTLPKVNLVTWRDIVIPNVTYDAVMVVDLKGTE